MRKALSLLAVATLATPSVFAASGDMTPSMVPPMAPTATQVTTVTPTDNPNLPSAPDMNAAPTVTPIAGPAQSMNLGEAQSVACTSNPAFGTNSCDQCFEAPAVKAGQRLTGLFDNWTNNTPSILIAFENEQKTPNMVTFGTNTKWSSNPTDETKIWKAGSDIAWIPSASGSNQKQFMLTAGQKVRFVESDLAAGYTLEKTDAKNGELVGMLRYPITFHVLDANGNQGAPKNHIECVAYKLSAPVVTPPPVKPTTPVEATKPQTGPAETLILIVAAFFIAFGLMFSLRKRV